MFGKKTTANYALDLNPAQKEVPTTPPATSANLLHQLNTFSITTPIQVHTLANYLENYDSFLANYLIQGFTFGFRIPYQGPRLFRLSKNLPSIKGKEHILEERITQELLHHRIAGPFQCPPFPNIQISPLGLVPKISPGEYRLIHHLSFPEEGSINHYIPKDLCTVQYQSIHTAIEIIQKMGKGALVAKTDLEKAYKQIPIIPDDFELLGFMLDNACSMLAFHVSAKD